MAKRSLEIVITGDSRGASRAFRGVERDANTLTGRLNNTGRAITRTFAAFGAAYGAQAAIRAVGRETIDFDKAMRNVNSIAQLSEDRLEGVSKAVLDLAGPTAQSPVKLAEGLYDLVSSGFSADQSLRILRSSAIAATAGLTTTEVSTKAVAAVLNAYQLPARKARDVSDVLFRTVDRGVISFEELAETVGDVLPFASSLDVSLREVGGAVATMTKAGISAPETMTRIKNVMVTLLKPGTDLKNALAAVGYESGEALVNQKGFEGSLQALIRTTDGSKESVAKLFPNIRALGGVLALTGKNSAQAAEDLRGMQNASGAANRAFEEQSKSVSVQWDRMKASAQQLAIELGNNLVPVAADLLEVLSDPDLSNEQKLNKISEVMGDQIRTVATEAPQILEAATPKVIGAGVILGKGLATGVVTGFVESDLLGKVLIGAGAVRLFGGPGALGKVGGVAGGLIGKGVAKTMPASMVNGLSSLAFGAVLSGGGVRGIGSALGGVLGTGASKAMASSLVKGIPIAAAAVGLATTAKAALDGDWREVGISGGAAVVGGLLGSLGGPMGAMLGAGIGASLGGPLESAFDAIFGSDKISAVDRYKQQLAQATATFRQLGQVRQRVAGDLAAANRRVEQSDKRAEAASRGVRQAEKNLIATRREYGPGSRQLIQAEARLASAKERSARATRDQRQAERLNGVAKQAAMAMYRREYALARRSIFILQEEAARKRRNFLEAQHGYRRGTVSLGQYAQAGRKTLQADNDLSRANQKLGRLVGDMSSKIGPKWVKRIQEMGQTQVETGKKIRVSNLQIGNLTKSWDRYSDASRRGGSTVKSSLSGAENAQDDFTDSSNRMRRRTNSNVRALVPVHETSMDLVTDSFSSAKSAIDGSAGPAIGKRRGGALGKRSGGLYPVKLSPGERVDIGSKSFIVPGRPEPRDSFYTQLPGEARVYTFDGQARLAMGEHPDSVLKTQAPHFREGGVVKPEIVGGSSGPRGVANYSIDFLHKAAVEKLKWIRENSISDLASVERMAARYGLQMTSGFRPGDDGWHGSNRARDFSNSSGPTPQMLAFARYLYNNHSNKLLELIYTPLGAAVKNYVKTGTYAEADHYDHVHVAMRGGGGVGMVVRGSATWFNGGATAGGSDTSRPGVSLNPGTWNSPLTRHWRDSSLDGNPYYARVSVGGKTAVLPITDMGPADWTGHSIDVTEGGLAKLGFNTGNFPSGTLGTARILGTQADRSQAVEQAARRRKGVKKLWNRIGRKGTTAAGRKRAELATKFALRAMKSAKHFNLDDVEDYLEKSKDFQKLAYGGIRRRQIQKRRQAAGGNGSLNTPGKGGGGGGGWGGAGGGQSRAWDPSKPFSATNAPGTNKLPKGINELLGMSDLGWDAKRGILDTALTRAEQTDTKVDDASALRAILGLETGRRNSSLQKARQLAEKIRGAGGLARAEKLAAQARKQGGKVADTEKALEKALDAKKVDKDRVRELREDLRKQRQAQRKAAAEAKRIRDMVAGRDRALENVNSATSEINQATQGLKDLNETESSDGTTGSGDASQLAEEIRQLREQIAKQNQIMSQAGSIDRLELMRAIGDLTSGLIAGTIPPPRHGAGYRTEANF